MNNTIKKTGPKDVFLQLGSVLGLYVSVFALGALVFGLINIYLPDVLSYDYGHYGRQGLRWPLAVLTIVWPLYLWLNSYIGKDLAQNPLKRELKIRKWLLYFTIFAAVIVIAGDLITLIFRFLGGELTTRFILKVVTVLAIAGGVFVYYGWNIRKDVSALTHQKMKIFVWAAVTLAFAAIIFGFFSAGSPQAERLRRFDERRVSDLQNIQYQIINYWQSKEVLPESLAALADNISGFVAPVDPETGEPYGYSATGKLDFELCAVFNTASEDAKAKDAPRPMATGALYPYDGAWAHASGRVCFSRNIDPELYPPLEKPIKR
ncbi:MAG: DUF5671 domain-containing protein [Patescibacteria group bacterium]